MGSKIVYSQVVDTDKDGIQDIKDLCPNTTLGLAVNTYGCPISLVDCDYRSTNFSLNIIGNASSTTSYLLVNSTNGIIEQINTNSPSFSNLTGVKTYMVLAYSYSGSSSGVTTGKLLSDLNASCQDFSNALIVKTCSPINICSPEIYMVNENGRSVSIMVTLSESSTSVVTVDFNTKNGTAQAQVDYQSTSGKLMFLPGETKKYITIPIIADNLKENNEQFLLSLSNAVGAILCNKSESIIEILNNDLLDDDGDGILNEMDLCPNTVKGSIVNEYGCEKSLLTCDYNTSSFSLLSPAPSAGVTTSYVLADSNDGRIVKVSNTPSFSQLSGTKTYMVLAFSNRDDGTLTNLIPNKYLKEVKASCYDWSNALTIKVCSPINEPINCDYTSSNISFKTLTSPSPVGTTQYVLTDQGGIIQRISNNTSFSDLFGTNTFNVYSISYSGAVRDLKVGKSINDIAGDCFDISNPLSIKVCSCKPNICMPFVIVKTKHLKPKS